jgi:DNA-binding transcriptional LysR family regulator
MELKSSQLRHFVNVASTKSFQEAARLGFRSQPAVSLAIKTLEDQFGGRLFESKKRGALTGLGIKVLPLISEFLVHHDRLVTALSKVAQGQVGDVCIAANPSVASRWLADIISQYTKRFPDVTVYASDDNSEKVRELVATGRADLGIASMAQDMSEIKFTPLQADDFGVVCRRDHPLNNAGGSLKWSALRGHSIIGNMTHRLLEAEPVYGYVDRPNIFMSTLTSLLANVEGGVGVTVLPKLAVPASHSNVIFLPLHKPRVRRTIGILERRGRTLPPESEAMRELIVDYFKTAGAK